MKQLNKALGYATMWALVTEHDLSAQAALDAEKAQNTEEALAHWAAADAMCEYINAGIIEGVLPSWDESREAGI